MGVAVADVVECAKGAVVHAAAAAGVVAVAVAGVVAVGAKDVEEEGRAGVVDSMDLEEAVPEVEDRVMDKDLNVWDEDALDVVGASPEVEVACTVVAGMLCRKEVSNGAASAHEILEAALEEALAACYGAEVRVHQDSQRAVPCTADMIEVVHIGTVRQNAS